MKRILIFVFALALTQSATADDSPKVFLTSQSTGNTWGAMRDQSQEMAKDFIKECPSVQITINKHDADYAVGLHHIEVGLIARDNQLAVTDMFGNVLSTSEKGSIKGGIKGACSLILADWSNSGGTRQKIVNADNAAFKKEGVMGYAEVSGDKLTVHSERASAMRFHMTLSDPRYMSYLRRSGLTTVVYTNDADQTFVYDVKSGQIAGENPTPNTVPAAAAQPAPVQNNVKVEQPHPVADASPDATADRIVMQSNESLGTAARQAKQHTECLKLASDNPNITCK
jgi:hypothetical protein